MDVIEKPSLTLRLVRPVVFGPEGAASKYSEIKLRCPRAADAKRAATCKPGVDSVITMLALIAEVPQEVIERLSPRDFVAACDFMSQFPESEYGE